ncbi:MAG: GntR family transcriptional regulator [Ruminococcaceae bacterium]|nr:GntR family transcriptional regulator [Oscillospiraceae bacterium]MBE6974569.1 GntR family transcriptional regulator [Oscillospiraceae bacterium]
MKNFKTTSLADQVFDKLENDIIHGVYARGEVLTELRLVEELGVSRTPIREALRRLEHEGLIEDSGKGSVVLGITEDDLLDIMNIRQRVEALASYYAALNITEEGRAELAHIVDLQDFYYTKWDVERLRRADDDFHDAICRFSGRTVVKDTLQPLHRKTRRYRRLAMEDHDRATVTMAEHRAIFEAIMAGDADRAAELTDRHIANAKAHMFGG